MNLKSYMVQNQSTAHSLKFRKGISSSNVSKRHLKGSKYTVPATLIKTPSSPTDSSYQRRAGLITCTSPKSLNHSPTKCLYFFAPNYFDWLSLSSNQKNNSPLLTKKGEGRKKMGSAITVFSLVAGRAQSSMDMALLIILSYPSIITTDNHVSWGYCPHFHEMQR